MQLQAIAHKEQVPDFTLQVRSSTLRLGCGMLRMLLCGGLVK